MKRVRCIYQRVDLCLMLRGRTCNLYYSDVMYPNQEERKGGREIAGLKKFIDKLGRKKRSVRRNTEGKRSKYL
jgi:hypothetical protein